MRLLKPDIDKLNEKYPKPEDAMKKQQAMLALYKSAGANPMGGCLPLLIQFPILIAMFRFFPGLDRGCAENRSSGPTTSLRTTAFCNCRSTFRSMVTT